MKPHFGQSDAAMNKLAGCNQFPNAGEGLEQIAKLEARAKELGFDTPLELLKSQHEEAAGMGIEPNFFERNPWAIRQMQPAVNMTENMTPIDENFDPVKERDAAYDLGYRDAQREGYYGHHNGCDCAVCEEMHHAELAKMKVDAAWNKLLDDYKAATLQVEKYRDALHIIAHMGISGLSWQADYEKCVNIAREALADRP